GRARVTHCLAPGRRRRTCMTVTLRPEDPASDEPFLRRLITETIAAELGAANWPEAVRDPLLNLQFANRRHGPQSSFPEGQSRIILVEGEPAGWLFFAILPDEIHLVEIMVLGSHRGKGAGSAAIREVLALAMAAGKPVRLTVNVLNAGAIRL